MMPPYSIRVAVAAFLLMLFFGWVGDGLKVSDNAQDRERAANFHVVAGLCVIVVLTAILVFILSWGTR